MATNYDPKHFTVRFPPEQQYVAHIEINRADKMNSFFEAYVARARPTQPNKD